MSTRPETEYDRSALRISTLHVRRMPGIPEGFTLPELSEGVTVVFGPNASGKSSTARAIEAVIWPSRGARRDMSVVAEYAMDGSRFRVEVDAGQVAVQCDGSDARPPELPAPELMHRYRLSLHELITSDNADFAKEIARQSAGGYDLAAAAEVLELRTQPSAARNESAAVMQAVDAERTAQRAQLDLEERARGLDELRTRKDAARAARERQQLLSTAVKYCTSAGDAERARAAVAGFPPELSAMNGTEHERLATLRKRIRVCADEIERARSDEREALAAASLLFDGNAPDHATLAALRARQDELRELQRVEVECVRTLEACTAREADARRAIGGAELPSDEQLSRIDRASFAELAELAREWERAQANMSAADAAHAAFGDAGEPEDVDALRMGVELLASWLAEGGDSGEGRKANVFLWGMALLAALGWGLHALRWHWSFAIVALAALLFALLGSRGRSEADRRGALRHEYERRRLPQPREWKRKDVRELHDLLHGKLAAGLLAAERSVLREKAGADRERASGNLRLLDVRRQEMAARLGVASDADLRQLSWLVERTGQWQSARLEVVAARAALESAHARFTEVLTDTAGALTIFGYGALDSTASIVGAIEELEHRSREHAGAIARAEQARRSAVDRERSRGALEGECDELLRGLGVNDDAAVESLCASYEKYRAACEAERFATQKCDASRRELRSVPGYDSALESATLAALEREHEDASSAAAELDELTAEVARLEQEVESAKRASDVEAAVATVETARAALIERRDRDLRAMIGGVIARHVQQLTRDQHRPEVFRRARELFALITRGRYQLHLEDGDNPSFRAFDVNAGVGRSLEELSSATRVQLMLAVRVAFVESQERRVALPLLLDETLGTSDDDRARAIIDAVTILAREGRQVFYFTAQHDEAGKWVAALEESGVPHAIVDLAAARGQRSSLALSPLPISSVTAADIPDPDGCSHDAYGVRLDVPLFRPGMDAPDSVPLWYVVDDVDELSRLMQSGVWTWGELRNLVENGGERIVDGCPGLLRRARAYATALDALCHEAAIGMGRPVDRAVLMDSGAVSEKQIDRVLALCDRCGGDASALVEGLERGGVSGFQKRKTAALREYLEASGHLDERPRRTEAQLRAAMQAAIAPAVSQGDLLPADLDTLLRRLESRRPSPASPSPASPDAPSPDGVSPTPTESSPVAAPARGLSQAESLAARISEG